MESPQKLQKIAQETIFTLLLVNDWGKDMEFARCEVGKKFHISNMLPEEPIMLCVKALEFDKPE